MEFVLSTLMLAVIKELGFTSKQALTWINALHSAAVINPKGRPSKPQAKANYGSPKANGFSLACGIFLAIREGHPLGMVDIKNLCLLDTGAPYQQAVGTLLATGYFSYEVDPKAKGFPIWELHPKAKAS